MPKQKSLTPYEELMQWAQANAVNPARFARDTGYTYNHCAMLFRDEINFTTELLGRVLYTYGVALAVPLMNAMKAREELRRSNGKNN